MANTISGLARQAVSAADHDFDLGAPKLKPADIITFLLIGAQKAGTTWLYSMLKEHPDIFLADAKEVHFFDWKRHYALGEDWYLHHFADRKAERHVGEFTPDYMWTHHSHAEGINSDRHFDVPEKVHAMLPDIKLLVSLRNPVTRAVSAFHHNRTRGRIPLNKSLRDMKDHFGILSMSRYDIQLEAWLKHYDLSRFCILFYETDIKPDTAKMSTINRVCDHLGAEPMQALPAIGERFNARKDAAMSYLNRVPLFRDKYRGQQVAVAINRMIPDRVQSMLEMHVCEADLAFLQETLEPHNRALETLLGRKLPW
ncbi:MAG: sulfotransferase domain-containing protein [Pseudomonadota bacterium]